MSRIDRAIRPRPDRRYPPFEPGDVKAPYTVIFRAGPHPPDHRGVPADGPPGFEAAGIVCRLSRPEPPPAGRGGPPARRIPGGIQPLVDSRFRGNDGLGGNGLR